MTVHVMKNCKAYLDAYDLTGQSNQVELKHSSDILDKTTFADTAKRREPGLKNVEVALEGFWEAGTGKIDTISAANLGVAGKIMTLCPEGGEQGEVFYSFKNMAGEYQAGAKVGELLPFAYNGGGSDAVGLIRGIVLENAEKTATANGAAQELDAVTAAQKVYAVMHILAVDGTSPTLDMEIESDDNDLFSSATTRFTFAQADAVGSQWLAPKDGPITDTFWRASWTVGGSGEDLSFTVFVGIAIL